MGISAVSAFHKVHFLAVGLFAIWVGAWGYFFPSLIDWAIPWKIPPLHARFISGMYLAGAVMMFLSMVQTRLSRVRIPTIVSGAWTGVLLLASLFHLDSFDWSLRQTWFWFFAYIVYPLSAATLAWIWRQEANSAYGRPLAHSLRMVLAGIAVVGMGLALTLFLFSEAMVEVWPWPINDLLAQIYSGPFFSMALAALLMAGAGDAQDCRIAAIGLALFTGLALLASSLHLKLFAPFGLAASLWYGGLAVVAISALAVVIHIKGRSGVNNDA